MTPDISLGAWIRRRRRLIDLTQAELANQVGCSPITIRKLETDERRPSKQLAEQLARHLKIPQEEQERFLAFARAVPGVNQTPNLTVREDEKASTATIPQWLPTQRVDWGKPPMQVRFMVVQQN